MNTGINYKVSLESSKDQRIVWLRFESETKQKQIKVSLSRDRIIKNPFISFFFEKIFEKTRFIGNFF